MQVVEIPNLVDAEVAVGAAVEVEWLSGERGRYVIAAAGESDLASQTISEDSALARSILGARAGDIRTYRAGGAVWTVTVVRVDGGTRVF